MTALRRIGCFQFELSHPQQAPHVGLSLLVDDARREGRDVDAALVSPEGVDAWLQHCRRTGYALIALDSVFTRPVVSRLRAACPDVPVLVGGTNALALFLTTHVSFAIVGAGRVAFRAFLAALDRDQLPGGVPNLFFRTGEGTVDHTGLVAEWSLADELEPYSPDFDWTHFGASRTPGANTRAVSVVPEWGCAFQRDAMADASYADIEPGTPSRAVAALPLSDAARSAIRPFLENTKGCAFCTFRYQPYRVERVRDTVARTLRQIDGLVSRYGVREISIQSEHPFRFLRELIDGVVGDDIPVRRFRVRTFPAVIARDPERVWRTLDHARRRGVHITLQQLGFENFSPPELRRLGKGLSAEDNRAAARGIVAWQSELGDAADLLSGHGFILFTPWTTPEDVATNIEAVDSDAPFLRDVVSPESRLCLYDPFNPIFRLAEEEGLVVPVEHDFGFDYRQHDPRTAALLKLVAGLAHEWGPSVPLSRALRAALPEVRSGVPKRPEAAFRAALRRGNALAPPVSPSA